MNMNINMYVQIYSDFCTPLEETKDILGRVNHFLSHGNMEILTLPWDWDMMKSNDHNMNYRGTRTKTRTSTRTRVDAIEDHLGVLPDGTFVPLTLRQRLIHWSPLSRLESKIINTRKKTKKITDLINSFKAWERDKKDNRLIKQFIFGCLTPFKQYALQAIIAPHEELSEEKISWIVYLLSWSFIICSMAFFLYWVFMWGLYNGDAAVHAWGITFGIAFAETALLVQVTEYYVIFYLPALAMQPQLQRIRSVLVDVSMNSVNRIDDDIRASDSNMDAVFRGAKTGAVAGVGAGAGVREGVRVPNEGEAAAQQQQQNDDDAFNVVQVLSPACRAAWTPELKFLPAAHLLRQVHIVHSFSYSFIHSKYNTLLLILTIYHYHLLYCTSFLARDLGSDFTSHSHVDYAYLFI